MTIDPARLKSQLQQDAEVLQALAQHGDNSAIARPIDLVFLVKPHAVEALKREVEKAGWFVMRTDEADGELFTVEAQVEGTTHPDAITALTKAALEIEARTGAEYDGWGTGVM